MWSARLDRLIENVVQFNASRNKQKPIILITEKSLVTSDNIYETCTFFELGWPICLLTASYVVYYSSVQLHDCLQRPHKMVLKILFSPAFALLAFSIEQITQQTHHLFPMSDDCGEHLLWLKVFNPRGPQTVDRFLVTITAGGRCKSSTPPVSPNR